MNGIWCMVYVVWYMVHGVWYMVYGVVYGQFLALQKRNADHMKKT